MEIKNFKTNSPPKKNLKQFNLKVQSIYIKKEGDGTEYKLHAYTYQP